MLSDKERLAEIGKYGSTSTEREQPENDRRFLLRLLYAERVKSTDAEHRGRIAGRLEARVAARSPIGEPRYGPDTPRRQVWNDAITEALNAIDALTTPPGQTSPAPGTDP